MNLTKLSFFTEIGNVVQQQNNNINGDRYVVLATIQVEPNIRSIDNNSSHKDIIFVKKSKKSDTEL